MRAFFDTSSTPQPLCSPKSLPVAFARSDMFKDVAVSDCLMMTGKIAGQELGRCPQTVETALVFYQPQFRGGGGGTPGSLTSTNWVLQEYFSPTVSVKMHPNL